MGSSKRETRARILSRRWRFIEASLAGVCAASVGCAANTPHTEAATVRAPVVQSSECEVNATAFEDALKAFAAQDDQGWSKEGCADVSRRFERLDQPANCRLPETIYNAGLVYERCGDLDLATAAYSEALSVDSGFYRARMRLAACAMGPSGTNVTDYAMRELEQAVSDAQGTDPGALVMLAWAHLQRAQVDDSEADFTRGRELILDALAINENDPKALHALVACQLASARRHAGRATRRLAREDPRPTMSAHAADLLENACDNALRRAPGHAPIQEICGVVHVERGDYGRASEAFDAARKLDPRRFSSHMNYAATRLLLRDFPRARQAYQMAFELRPHDLEARLGLVTSIRHDPSSTRETLEEAARLLEAPQADAPARPEATYSLALLTWTMARNQRDDRDMLEMMSVSRKLFSQFIDAAQDAPHLRDSVEDARKAIEGVNSMICLLIEGP